MNGAMTDDISGIWVGWWAQMQIVVHVGKKLRFVKIADMAVVLSEWYMCHCWWPYTTGSRFPVKSNPDSYFQRFLPFVIMQTVGKFLLNEYHFLSLLSVLLSPMCFIFVCLSIFVERCVVELQTDAVGAVRWTNLAEPLKTLEFSFVQITNEWLR